MRSHGGSDVLEPQVEPVGVRSELARELHDGPIQDLTAAVVRLEGFRGASADRRMQDAISDIEENVRHGLLSLRRIIGELREEPPALDLGSALESMLDGIRTTTDTELVLVKAPSWPDAVTEPAATNMLRVLQEALGNAVRHAGARHVVIELAADDECLVLTTSDDGVGIAPGTRRGAGILGMRERAAILGGRLVMRRRHPGTEVRLEVPRR